jgi:Xaa-Pro aminopeptidase
LKKPSSEWLNIDGIDKQIQERDLDAVVAVSPENFFYLSRVFLLTQRIIRDRLAFTLWPRDEEPSIIVCEIEEGTTELQSWIKDIRTYIEFSSPIELLCQVLDEKGLGKVKIGIEKKYLAALWYEELTHRLPEAEFFEVDSLFDKVRSVKARKEIDVMKKGAKIVDKALLAALEYAAPGDSEKEIYESITSYARDLGRNAEIADVSARVLSGPNMNVMHHPTTDRKIEPGDLVNVTCRATFNHYWIHIIRRAVVGEPDPLQESVYSKYRKVYLETMNSYRPGVKACDIFEKTKKELLGAGLSFPDKSVKTGHGTGIAVHEDPRIRPDEPWILEPGMVFAHEPVVIGPKNAIYHVEDEIIVTESDPIRISDIIPLESLYEIR